jgi:hypothetical protein
LYQERKGHSMQTENERGFPAASDAVADFGRRA